MTAQIKSEYDRPNQVRRSCGRRPHNIKSETGNYSSTFNLTGDYSSTFNLTGNYSSTFNITDAVKSAQFVM